jgi:hypothetical protein
MNRIEGTSARQLELLDSDQFPEPRQQDGPDRSRRQLRLLQKDIYAELARRRRRAQIAARHLVEPQG